ncbi:hypothetical protein FF38_10283 [Lucilia cuprina]|uniref:RING-CH-type domain-containing protein n=1 Tax=Lucilia cuprina TaxID=7375 RepID=A0A0L0CQX9_LUCCU|nr:E3 ubiquitin-protein ligase MARCH6 [Lucilia cuprina]KNC34656.1 hypothetical protein FF38_10283 [Lucilia cuprina]
MSTSNQIIHALSEATAIRLFNSVVATDQASERQVIVIQRQTAQTMQQNSIESIRSSNEFNHSCRICRWNRSDMEITKCPCLCKGSVGFIHLQCLKRWIMQRRDNHCEICNATFNIPEEKFSLRRMLKTFFGHCAAPIAKHLLYCISLLPLTHIILQQVVICMENINLSPQEQLTIKEVVLASSALMTSSALFFHFFEFIATRLILIRNILRHWWMFGNASDFALIPIESDILDLFRQ